MNYRQIITLAFLIGAASGSLALMSAGQPGVAAAGLFGLGLFGGLAVVQFDRMFLRRK